MFFGFTLISQLDISNFDTSNVQNMSGMFGYLTLTFLDVSNFVTSKAILMDKMFYSKLNLESIELKYFRTSNVEDMSKMFADCKQLKKILKILIQQK